MSDSLGYGAHAVLVWLQREAGGLQPQGVLHLLAGKIVASDLQRCHVATVVPGHDLH